MMKGQLLKLERSSFVQEKSMRLRSMWMSALGLGLAVAVAACGGGNKESSATTESAASGGGQKIDPATVGEITGVVSFDGVAPKNEPIKMNADPVCVKENPTAQTQETWEVADGKLANVFVYIKDGLGNYSYDAPSGAVTIDQKGCRYHPHILAVRIGQN